MFRRFRIVVLLYTLILVGGSAWLTRTDSTDWQEPLWVLVYPINADHSNAADTYIENLEREHFSAIERFFRRQGQTYGLELDRPVTVRVAAPLFGVLYGWVCWGCGGSWHSKIFNLCNLPQRGYPAPILN